MDRKLKRKLAVAATGLVALLGAGGTYAATQGSGKSDRQAFLSDVAKRLHVTPDQLTAALQGALSDRLDKAVAAGKLTRAQADAILAHAKQHGGVGPFFGPGPGFGPAPRPGAGPGPRPGLGLRRHGPPPGFRGGPPPGHLGPGHAGPVRAGLDAAAKYLGLTDAQLIAQLRAGKSLSDVAGARKKSLDGLKSALQAAVKSKLDDAVSARRLTKAQEQRILGELKQRIGDLVTRKIGPRGGPRGGPQAVPRFPSGPAPSRSGQPWVI